MRYHGNAEKYIMRSFMIIPITRYYSHIESEMGGACNTYGGEERCIQGFGGEVKGKLTTWKTQAQMGG
jgi:hypothetical protein